ncbi:hypothetical protein KXW25_003033 [Aspergillus fumigatus]|nr:hypothetical protein KXW25_003033 [Aspergillus fumigatus]
MPRWLIQHSPNTLTPEEKSHLAQQITQAYVGFGLPAFYVQVHFIEQPAGTSFIGGEQHPNFVALTIYHLARTMTSDEQRQGFLKRIDAFLTPMFEPKGIDWEYFVTEAPRDLWKINGLAPPAAGSEEKVWVRENRPHFTQTLISTIEEFSATERAKYPPPAALPKSGPLYDAAILSSIEEKYHLGPHATNSAVSNPLSEEFQDVDYWISQAPYSTATAHLADAVKMLIISNEMLALLRLANHEKIPLMDLNHLSWGHSFGVTHVADVALEIYMLLNIAASVKANAKPGSANETGCLTETRRFRSFASWGLGDFDFPAQDIPHRLFWNTKCITDGLEFSTWDPLRLESDDERREMKEYSKMCFELLYRYDLLLKEMGGDPEWKEEILGILHTWGARCIALGESGFCFI